jgi:hypothetical protein
MYPEVTTVLDRIPEDKLREMSDSEISELTTAVDEARGFVNDVDPSADIDQESKLDVEEFRLVCRGDVWRALYLIVDKLDRVERRLDALTTQCLQCSTAIPVKGSVVETPAGMFCSEKCAELAEVTR